MERGRRAIASWSQTYGITDEAMPTPIPAASATGSVNAGTARPARQRRHDDQRHEHRSAERVDAARFAAAGDAVPEHDVEREEDGVGERERDAERLPLEPHVREQVDAGDGQEQREAVPRRPRSERRQRDHRQELDRRDRSERQPVDREVEAGVHHREHGAPGDHGAPRGRRHARVRPPRPAPEREDRRGRGDPQPGDAEDVHPCEEQHGERGAEVVEHRAADEVGVRR